MSDGAAARDLLAFWFGAPGPDGEHPPRAAWWKADAEFDAACRSRFGDLAERAAAGALDGWQASAEGCLALVLLLDQMPRNLHRGSAAAFATDPPARAVARHALAAGYERDLSRAQRLFLYLPFEHSEDLADQDLACRLIADLGNAEWAEHAERHRAVIARFGRFPHRNRWLGRETTAEEAAFLKEPGSRF